MRAGGGRGARAAAALVAMAAAAVASPPLAAQAPDPCTPPSGDTGFYEIEANVFAGTFDKVLPFDVPLRICAQVPEGTEAVSVRVARSKRKLTLDEPSCADPAAGGPWGPALPGRVDSETTPGTTVARIVVPRLDAQQYYAFCFLLDRPLTEEEMKKFQPEVLAAVDRQAASVTSANFTGPNLEALRADVASDLAGSLLAITGAERVERGLAELVAEVIEPQLRNRLIQQGAMAEGAGARPTGLATLQDRLKTALDEIRTSAPLAKLVALLEQEAATNVVLRDLLAQTYAGAVGLTRYTDGQATAAATGQDPAAPAGADTLASTRDSAVATAAAQRFNGLDAALESLSMLIEKMTGAEGPAAVRAGLDDADRAALRALVAPGGAIFRAVDLTFTLAGEAQRLAGGLAERERAVADFAGRLRAALRRIFVADGSTTGNFDTFSNWYISADAGLVWSSEVDEVVPYVGTNIYLRPVNKNAPLRTLGSFRQTLSRRFAFTLGLTAQSIADKGTGTTGQTRDDLFGTQSLLVGAGLRLTDMIRVGAGALVFKQLDPNPLIDDQRTGRALYFTVSFDLNVARAFQGGLGGLFGGGGGGNSNR